MASWILLHSADNQGHSFVDKPWSGLFPVVHYRIFEFGR